MRNLIVAIFIAAILILLGAYAFTKLRVRNQATQNPTDTQPLVQIPDATFIPFPTSNTTPSLTLASTAPVATSSTMPSYSCQYLTALPTTGIAPFTTKFTATGLAVGTDRAYMFDFGEGTPATQTGTSVTHTYQNPGTYIAKLEVRDSRGNKVNLGENCARTITVTGKPQATTAGKPTQLPQTGPEAFILVLLAPVVGIGAWLFKRFKLL